MAKKTRKQKILADSRHVQYHLETTAQVSYPSEKKPKLDLPDFAPTREVKTTNLSSSIQVIADIKKTAYITGVIITAQVLLYIALNGL